MIDRDREPRGVPLPETEPAGIPEDQRPDERELVFEQDLLAIPGVQSAGLAGDAWVVHLRPDADPEAVPRRLGERRVEIVRLDT